MPGWWWSRWLEAWGFREVITYDKWGNPHYAITHPAWRAD